MLDSHMWQKKDTLCCNRMTARVSMLPDIIPLQKIMQEIPFQYSVQEQKRKLQENLYIVPTDMLCCGGFVLTGRGSCSIPFLKGQFVHKPTNTIANITQAHGYVDHHKHIIRQHIATLCFPDNAKEEPTHYCYQWNITHGAIFLKKQNIYLS